MGATGEEGSGTFEYANPETIHWGEGCVTQRLGAELDRVGAARVAVVTTRSVAENRALMAEVERALGERLVGVHAGIGEHAPARAVAEAALATRKADPLALVSVGGGSPIDAAKTIAFVLATGLDVTAADAPRRARGISLSDKRVLPHFAVPTTLSVAELSPQAGFSAAGTREKVGVAAPELRCAAVFYDGALALHTPLDLWLSTGIRAVDHGVETLLAPGEHPLPDLAALDGLRRLAAALREVKNDPRSPAARTACQLGAWFAYLLPGPAARGLSHTLGKRIGSRHGIPHGVTSCLLLPHVMRFVAGRNPRPLERIAAALGANPPSASAAADAVQALIAELGLPQRIAPFGLSDGDLVEAVRPLAGKEHAEAELLGIMRAAY
jgi:alcohol dehydrogenase